MTKKTLSSIGDSLSYIESLKNRIERMPDLLGFKSSDIAKSYRTLIQLSNSLAIIFLQYDLNDLALVLLKYASDADLKLSRYGTALDKHWEGNLLTYNNLILLFHKVNHYKESLKLIHQAQSFILSLKKANQKLLSELELSTHMLSFITLWRLGRYSDSVTYIQSSADIINKFIQNKQTKLSNTSLDNLYGIIAASLAGVKIVVEKNKQEALEILYKALSEIDENAICRGILENLMNYIGENSAFKVAEENQEDWLCGKMYHKILIITSFVPLIDPRTPLIRVEELEMAKQKPLNESSLPKIESLSKLEDPKVNIDKHKASNSVIISPLLSPHPRRIVPWWESKQFLGNFKGRSSYNNSSFLSEPRRRQRIDKVYNSVNVPREIPNSSLDRPLKFFESGLKQSKNSINSNFNFFS
jgi:hypothetical protein